MGIQRRNCFMTMQRSVRKWMQHWLQWLVWIDLSIRAENAYQILILQVIYNTGGQFCNTWWRLLAPLWTQSKLMMTSILVLLLTELGSNPESWQSQHYTFRHDIRRRRLLIKEFFHWIKPIQAIWSAAREWNGQGQQWAASQINPPIGKKFLHLNPKNS